MLGRTTNKDFLERVQTYLDGKEFEPAIVYCNQIVANIIPHDVSEADTYFVRAQVYQAQGNYPLAIQDFDKNLFLIPNHRYSYLRRGQCYLLDQKYHLAIKDLTKLLLLKSHQNELINADGYRLRGITYFYLKNYDEARKDYSESLMIDEDDEVYYLRSITYLAQHNLKEGLKDLNKAIRLNPMHAKAFNCRGYVYHELSKGYFWNDKDKLAKAIRDHTKSIELEPSALAFSVRGSLYFDQGELVKAVKDFKKALELDPENKKILYSLFSAGMYSYSSDFIEVASRPALWEKLKCRMEVGIYEKIYLSKSNFLQAILEIEDPVIKINALCQVIIPEKTFLGVVFYGNDLFSTPALHKGILLEAATALLNELKKINSMTLKNILIPETQKALAENHAFQNELKKHLPEIYSKFTAARIISCNPSDEEIEIKLEEVNVKASAREVLLPPELKKIKRDPVTDENKQSMAPQSRSIPSSPRQLDDDVATSKLIRRRAITSGSPVWYSSPPRYQDQAKPPSSSEVTPLLRKKM